MKNNQNAAPKFRLKKTIITRFTPAQQGKGFMPTTSMTTSLDTWTSVA